MTVVGFFDNHGFIFDGIDWTLIDVPGAAWTQVTGGHGEMLFGKYQDDESVIHGFMYSLSFELPNVSTFSLLLLGLVSLYARSMRAKSN